MSPTGVDMHVARNAWHLLVVACAWHGWHGWHGWHLLVVACAWHGWHGVRASECNFGYIPLNAPTRHVSTDAGASWEQMAQHCFMQFTGHSLVGRHFLELSHTDKALCGDAFVPLGIAKIGEDLAFPGGRGLKSDPVDEAALAYKENNVPSPSSATVAGLNLTTYQWRLVDARHLFTCALCQMSHRAEVNTSITTKPAARVDHVYYAIAEDARSSNPDEPAENMFELISEELNVTRTDVSVNKTVRNVRNYTEFSLRIRSPWSYNVHDFVAYNVSEDYHFVDFYDAAFCRSSNEEGLSWPYNSIGTVVTKKLDNNVVATRECTFRRRPDGDWDAEWDAVVFWDFSQQAQCYLDEIKAVAKDITNFAAKPPAALDIGVLVKQLVDRIDSLSYVNASEVNAERNKVFRAVTSIVGNFARSSSFQSLTANNYFGDVLLSNLRDADPQIGFRMTSVPGRVKGDFGPVRISELGKVETDLTLVLSNSMYNRKAGLAFAVVKDYQKDLFPTPVKKIVENSGYYMSNGIVMVMSFDNDDQMSLSDDYFLEVEIRNVGAENETAKYLRNFAVWAIDDNEKLTETCLLVDTVKADTYKCRKMIRSPKSRMVHGRYVANRGYNYDEVTYDTLEAAKLIDRYTNIQVDGAVLTAVSDIANYLTGLKFGGELNDFLTRSTMLGGLREVLSTVEWGGKGTVLATSDRRVAFLVGDLKQAHRMVGFSKNKSVSGGGKLPVEPIHNGVNVLSRRTSEVNVVLSPALVAVYSRLAFSVFDDYDDLFPEDSLAGQVYRKVTTVQIVLVSDTIHKYDFENELYYFEIFFDASAADAAGQTGSARRRRCVLWNPEGGANDRWSTSACYKLKSTRGAKQVFRCNAFHHGLTRAEKLVADGVYLTFEVNEFNDFLSENVILLVWLVVECVVSLSSLLSIFSTAIVIRKWREDLGHQILLHMTLALAINIMFGFVNNFLLLDTESVACIAVGMIRHYSYMAMFFWMFVLSALQLKRLLSVLGARSTPNLQLKVAVFAWGLPLLVILVLLFSVQDAYRSVVKDRGFCYPEGLGFEVFVQGPAGLVLALNVLIFVVILARIFACFGWGETANLQRHANVRTVQLRRLRTAFFIFFLFGLSWTFHFLAEEGVIRNKFIFEYLFLMTACLHVFMLALFFVYLDEGTRKEWKVVFEDSAPMRLFRGW